MEITTTEEVDANNDLNVTEVVTETEVITGADLGENKDEVKKDDLKEEAETDLDEEGEVELKAKKETPEEKAAKEKQEKIDHAFIQKQKEVKKAEERAKAFETRTKELEEKLAKYEKTERPVVSEIPMPYDPEFDIKIAKREEEIRAQVSYDLDQKNKQAQYQDLNKQKLVEYQEHIKSLETSFGTKAEEFGMDLKALKTSESLITPHITPDNKQTMEFILGVDEGPLIVQYLAANPMELDKVAKMRPVNASVYLATNVIPQAVKLKPGKSKTPAPANIPKGRSKTEHANEYEKGVTYE